MKRLAVILAALVGLACTATLRVVHVAEEGCKVVPLLLADGTASAVCVVVDDLATVIELLAEAQAKGTSARWEQVGKDGSRRVVEVSAGHVPTALAAAKSAQVSK